MRVLVTGGCGYIGSLLVPRLQADDRVDEVAVLDSLSTGTPRNLIGAHVSDHFDFYRGDVREYADVEHAMRDADAVVHLAAITGADSTHRRRQETFAVNYDGATNVFAAATKLDVSTVVFASSCNVYGRATTPGLDEAVDPDPLNPYAEAKHAAEQELVERVSAGQFGGTALRMSTNYGHAPGIRFNLVVNKFVFRALTDRQLTVYGDGRNWRPFIHVEDAARAFLDAVVRPDAWSQLVYNVGADRENYRISEVAEIVREEVTPDLEVSFLEDERPGPSYHVAFERVRTTDFELGWTLREGVRDLASRFTRRTDPGHHRSHWERNEPP